MTDINFNCPQCGQNITAEPGCGGRQLPCPTCATVIQVPPSTSAGTVAAPLHYYLLINSQKTGPYSKEQVCEWLRQNPTMGGTPGWAEGWPEWRPLADTDEFRSVPVDALMSEPAHPPVKRWDADKKCWVVNTKTAGGVEGISVGRACPNCKKTMGTEDVLCTNCGFDLRTGKAHGIVQPVGEKIGARKDTEGNLTLAKEIPDQPAAAAISLPITGKVFKRGCWLLLIAWGLLKLFTLYYHVQESRIFDKIFGSGFAALCDSVPHRGLIDLGIGILGLILVCVVAILVGAIESLVSIVSRLKKTGQKRYLLMLVTWLFIVLALGFGVKAFITSLSKEESSASYHPKSKKGS